MVLLLLACAGTEPSGAGPPGMVLEGVRAEVDGMASPGWVGAAGVVLVQSGTARAAGVTLSGGKAPLEIAAARSEWDLRGRKAVFTGDVTVTRAEVSIRCGRLEVAYKDVDTLSTVEATGGVSVTRDGRTATAERAVIVGETGQITLTGAPRLAEGVNTLQGEVITLFLDDERAVCEGKAGSPCRLSVDGSALK